jgi:hypothetical protein
MRKHRRLLAVDPSPARFTISTQGQFTPIATGFMRANDKTVLGLIPKGAPKPKMELFAYIAIDETDLIERRPAVAVLDDFASLARSIIERFDS